ncbi:MAG: hypothetical protein H6739_15535 [Alphaproteobacteria bacterium]|nr:hypothetical protein [Alphaproteobacteria bacterium]
MLLLALTLACRPPASAPAEVPEVRFRPSPEPPTALAEVLVSRVPGSTWDRGLAHAAGLLLAAARDPADRITPQATAAALDVAGYPGQARFAKEFNAGAFPEDLAAQLAAAALERRWPVDVALVKRNFGDGTTLWIGAVSPRPALLDPMPRAVPMDELVPVRVEMAAAPPLVLFVAPPDGPVRALPISAERAMWVDGFHVPGAYRLEVVSAPEGRPQDAQVLLLWSLFVDDEPEPPARLPQASLALPNPIAAADGLYARLDALREGAGLKPVARFPDFEPLAREHAAFMASTGNVAHALPGLTEGVAARANRRFHPESIFYEDVAAAMSAEEALALVELSPGHRRHLLCEPCTHVSIGAALEPVTDRAPRLFVTWELLEFPNGPPKAIESWDR